MWPVNEYAYNLFATSFHAQFIVNRFAFDIFCHLYVCSACVCTHFLVLIKLSLIIFDANAQLLRNVLYKWWPQQASKQANQTNTDHMSSCLPFAFAHESIQTDTYQAYVWRKMIECARSLIKCMCGSCLCCFIELIRKEIILLFKKPKWNKKKQTTNKKKMKWNSCFFFAFSSNGLDLYRSFSYFSLIHSFSRAVHRVSGES